MSYKINYNSTRYNYFKTKNSMIKECRRTFQMILKLWDIGLIKD